MIQKIVTAMKILALMLFTPPKFLQVRDLGARADVESAEYTQLYSAAQLTKMDSTKQGGRVRYMVATYTQGTADGNIGDRILIGRLPKGARRVPGGMCFFSAGNANATLAVGYVGAAAAYAAATAITNAGSVGLDVCFAGGAEQIMAAETDLIATNATAAIKAAQKITFHIPYTFD